VRIEITTSRKLRQITQRTAKAKGKDQEEQSKTVDSPTSGSGDPQRAFFAGQIITSLRDRNDLILR
jgi:hypothetical protein